MSKIDEVRSAMVAAMKAGNKERKAALSFLLSSLKNKAIDKRADLTEEEDEIKAVIREVLSGLGIEKPLPKDKGRIMKELMPKVKGKADGKVVNGLVASFME